MTQHKSDSPVAVITGGASGIGLAFARAYAARGARVVIADIDEDAMTRARLSLTDSGAVVDCVAVDLRYANSVTHLGEVATSVGRLSAVCLNAGVTSTGAPIWETPEQAVDFVIGVNLRSLYYSIRTFVPALIAQGGAADLIITASMAGMVASPYIAAYAASKAGAVALAKSLRAELATVAPSIRCALLNPGMVKTNLIRTSAARQPAGAGIPEELVAGSHEALNSAGVEPDEAVSWALKALEHNLFWALPPAADAFACMLDLELHELRDAISW
jgi:NAD(P)-dependent dehydrogenase (short-subunit alcohol dehydrogenase family)